jgi:diguanylate cyclase (GGDEF)-like protein
MKNIKHFSWEEFKERIDALRRRGEITEEDALRMEETYRFLTTDKVTGLKDRKLLEEGLLKRLEDMRLRKSDRITVLFFDLKKFGPFNKKYGHNVGDRVLGEFGKLLKRSLYRHDDIFRYGGDETVVILPDTDEDGTKIVLDRINNMANRRKRTYLNLLDTDEETIDYLEKRGRKVEDLKKNISDLNYHVGFATLSAKDVLGMNSDELIYYARKFIQKANDNMV